MGQDVGQKSLSVVIKKNLEKRKAKKIFFPEAFTRLRSQRKSVSKINIAVNNESNDHHDINLPQTDELSLTRKIKA